MSEWVLERPPVQPAARPGGAEAPFISVIVPVRNEAAFLGATLRGLLTQRYDPRRFEVLVAEGGSTDRTLDVIADWQADHSNLRLVANPRRWSSAGRNAAVRAARGDLVVLIDGHCQMDDPNYLNEIAAAFARGGADCVGRPQPLDVRGANRLQRTIAAARTSRLGHHPDSHVYSDREGLVPPQSVAVAYRRTVFEQVGLFDESFDACEDVELNHRVAQAGLTCFFTPRVAVRYHPRGTLTGLVRQMIRYGRGRVRLLRKHPETFTLAGFLPAAFLAGLVAGPLLAWWFPLLALVYGGVLGLYALTVAAFSIGLAWRERRWDLLPLFPLVFLAIHLGAGAGILWETLASRRSEPAEPELLPARPAVPRRRAA
jgi:succinoglycan biosynthesis protein ExoA